MKAQNQDFGGLHEANLSSLDRRNFHHAGGGMSRSEVSAGIADQSTRDFVSHSARASSLNNMMMAERDSHSLNRLCSSSFRRTTNGLHATTNLSHECLRLSESIDCDGNSDDDDEQTGTTRVGCTPGGSNVPFPTGVLSASVWTFLNRTKRMADANEDSSLRSFATDADTSSVGMKKLPEAPVEIIKPQKTKAQKGGENLVMVAFDANVKEMSHSAIIWALQNVLNRGDVLALVGILDCVKGPLGLRTPIGDHAWIKANRKVVEEEVKLKKQTIRGIPGLDYRCQEAGVKLVVDVKAFHRPEVMVIAEAINLEASHVVLDKSLKNKNRKYYLENSACPVTRMRRNGGVDTIILLQAGSMESSKQTKVHMSSKDGIKSMTPPSPTSVIRFPLSYRFQTDVFEIKLRPKKQPSSIAPSDHSSSSISTPMSTSSSAPYASSTPPSSVVSSQVRLSFTSSSNHTDDTDEELFSIYHGSTRHNPELLDADLFSLKPELGYESDDLFSICSASTRRETIALSPSTSTRQQQHSSAVSISDPMPSFQKLTIDPDSPTRRSMNANASTSCSCSSVDAAVSSSLSSASASSKVNLDVIQLEQLTEATISRLTFVVGLGDAVDVNLSNALQPGEAILVGSSPSALFLLHAEKHLRGLYPFRVSAGPPSLYVAIEGGMAMKLAHLETNQRVVVVNARGQSRAVPVAYTALQRKPLVLVEVQCGGRRQSVMLHHAEFVCLVARGAGGQQIEQAVFPVNKLKVGDKVLLRLRRQDVAT